MRIKFNKEIRRNLKGGGEWKKRISDNQTKRKEEEFFTIIQQIKLYIPTKCMIPAVTKIIYTHGVPQNSFI